MKVDIGLLERFEDQLDTSNPTAGEISAKILGYGEISAIFLLEEMPEVALKRMPPFSSPAEVERYIGNVQTYCDVLRQELDFNVVENTYFKLENRHQEHILYIAQPRLPAEGIGNTLIGSCSPDELEPILNVVVSKLSDIWRWNKKNAPDQILGLDGQISNWCFEVSPRGGWEVVYFDNNTPMMRSNGEELLDPEMFLKSCPSFLVWLVRWQFLQEVLDRYYDLHLVLTDLVANFHKEGRADLIPGAIEVVNQLLESTAADLAIEPLNQKEVDSYYKNDAFIWRLFLGLRRFDRFLKTKIFRQKYDFILPGKIKR